MLPGYFACSFALSDAISDGEKPETEPPLEPFISDFGKRNFSPITTEPSALKVAELSTPQAVAASRTEAATISRAIALATADMLRGRREFRSAITDFLNLSGVSALPEPTFADVLDAAKQIRPFLAPTPLRRYPSLDRLAGASVFVKHENHNPTGAFKVRGGVNLVSRLSEDERSRGVIAASTGNHGQSVAFAARQFGVSAIICAPAVANPVKVESMQDLGAEVILEGERYDDSRRTAERLAREHGYRYIHSGDEPLLIAGVGTHTLELLHEQPDIEVIFVPIGGGSGAAGACIVAKAVSPAIRVIGVQSEQAPSAYLSWKSGELQDAPNRTRAEGLSTAAPFELPQRILRRHLDDFVLVSDDEIDAATSVMIEKTRTLVEAAGAAALAGAIKMREKVRGMKIALICSGGNISPAQLRALLS